MRVNMGVMIFMGRSVSGFQDRQSLLNRGYNEWAGE
jgi:hypothetical protein